MKRDASSVSPVGGGGGGGCRAMALSSMAALHYVCVSMFQWGTVESSWLLVNMCVWKIRSVFAGTTNGDFFRPNVLSFFFFFFLFCYIFFLADAEMWERSHRRTVAVLKIWTFLHCQDLTKNKKQKCECVLFLFVFGFFQISRRHCRFTFFSLLCQNEWLSILLCLCVSLSVCICTLIFFKFYFFICLGGFRGGGP